nr:MAG TPA: hypothetical protein [Caudoviricetes sp.]
MLSTVAVIVLSSLSWLGGLSSLPMSQSCSPVHHRSTPHGGDPSHKANVAWVLTDIGRVWYTRAHVPIYAKGTPRCS